LTRVGRPLPGRSGCLTRTAGRHVIPIMTLMLGTVAAVSPVTTVHAQAGSTDTGSAARYFAVPIELDLDSGADNGDASILKFAPLYKIPLGKRWSLVNLDLVTLADAPGGVPGQPGNPSPEAGGRAFGLADLTHASFFTPQKSGNFIYGFGAILTLPVATAGVLGSDKWSAGPAFRVVYRNGPWNIGFFGGNQKSFAGSGARPDVDQLLIRGAIRRRLSDNWFLVSAPVITANWNAQSGQKWVVPVGGGVGRRLGPELSPWAVSVQGYVNAIKPDGAPDWVMRLSVVAAIPLGNDQ